MAALTSAPFVVLFACSWIFVLCEDSQEVTGEAGQDVTLHCQGPRDAAITLLEWNRPDLKSEKYVFFCRENRPYKKYQLPSFEGRVELKHPEMKDGDASVILKNVTINDTGTYECIVSVRRSGRRKRATELRHFINLKVTDSGLTAGHSEDGGNKEGGNKEGNVGLKVGLPVGVLLVVGIVGITIFKKRKGLPENNSYQPADKEVDHQQV